MGNEETDPTTQGVLSPFPGPRCASIVLIYGGELGRRHPLTEDTTVGRDESNSVTVDLTGVSRRHARLFERAGVWHVVDLRSTNGTYVNRQEIRGETALVNGDLLKLGGAVFKFIEGGNLEALYHEEIHRLTILDGLTGVHNRRFLMDFLEREIARSARYGRPLSLAMMDIDHFKRLNDTHGHLAGDHVLQTLAQVIVENTRREELFARYGGEEFAFVLPETGNAQAGLFCERIRQLVEDQVIEFDGQEIRMTVSLGAASMRPAYGLDDLITAADEQLYRAKRAGRNRVVCESSGE